MEWSVLLTGSVGPTIATVGLFVVYYLTTHRDRRLEGERRAYEAELRAKERLDAAMARAARAAIMQPKDLDLIYLAAPRQALELFDACFQLAGILQQDHPIMADWVMRRYNVLQATRHAHWRYALIPWVRRRSAERWGREIAALLEGLYLWQHGNKPDDDFAEHAAVEPATQ